LTSKELYCLGVDDKLTVAVKADHSFSASPPAVLFNSDMAWNDYDVAPDGKRFLISTQGSGAKSPPITVVVNGTTYLTGCFSRTVRFELPWDPRELRRSNLSERIQHFLASLNGDDAAIEPADAFGRFVDKRMVAINHDHYFNFRLDLDVDGPQNNFEIDRLVTKRLPESHPRRSLWVCEPVMARTESDAQLNVDHHQNPALWRVLSTKRTNKVGYPSSYQVLPGMSIQTLLTENDYPRRRAGFINHHLWVTPYRPEERFAAGNYPTLSEPGQGLPPWTAANRSIHNTDIVLWYSLGMHHMVRAEDWPVMPVLWHSFELRPLTFLTEIRL
jgi:hypothetical protein